MSKLGIRPGCSYLLKEEEPKRGIRYFKKLLNLGFKGLCITKIRPEEVRKSYDLKKTKIFQLNDKKGIGNLSPKSPVCIINKIEEFTSSTRKGAILFEGLDKLIEENNFLNTMSLLEDINDTIMTSESSLILSLDDSKFSKKELAFLERNLELSLNRGLR
ncbi:MAG: DUF835 domain-containing protein [Candidatus Thermoplasmatota archaeon]|nr:DUF835 domain-containing protein [Candidatus Thermoplasmatota archaeon]MBU4189915.1 DUF835 domain-containing protein [Candidatus Thermoplasmatota archaeon]MCG2737642.1 DUF835 domain-containing protein [Candidatus Methanoperedenaceae archaeon]MCG2826782.1 DUF835 domain-containing protein [Thermoplasmatales archaeon]